MSGRKTINNQSFFTKEELTILNDNYGTAYALRQVLLNIFNPESYPNANIHKVKMADDKHMALFHKIFNVPWDYINGTQIQKDINTDWWKIHHRDYGEET